MAKGDQDTSDHGDEIWQRRLLHATCSMSWKLPGASVFFYLCVSVLLPEADDVIVSWRIPIGDSGLLDFFLGVLSVDGLRQALKIHVLRLIGNSCADTGMLGPRFCSV